MAGQNPIGQNPPYVRTVAMYKLINTDIRQSSVM